MLGQARSEYIPLRYCHMVSKSRRYALIHATTTVAEMRLLEAVTQRVESPERPSEKLSRAKLFVCSADS